MPLGRSPVPQSLCQILAALANPRALQVR